jgi:hypothetical protein
MDILEFNALVSEGVRVTPDNRYSVYDVIRACGKKNPTSVWISLTERFPGLQLTEKYKFPGRGQRDTPVATKDFAYWVAKFMLKDPDSVKVAPKEIYAKGMMWNEAEMRDAVARFCAECGESVRTEVTCSAGRADIVTSSTVIEVKRIEKWMSAVGQVLAYSAALNLPPELALFGDCRRVDANQILQYCSSEQIACSIYDTSNGDADAMIRGVGCWTYTNMEDLTAAYAIQGGEA